MWSDQVDLLLLILLVAQLFSPAMEVLLTFDTQASTLPAASFCDTSNFKLHTRAPEQKFWPEFASGLLLLEKDHGFVLT